MARKKVNKIMAGPLGTFLKTFVAVLFSVAIADLQSGTMFELSWVAAKKWIITATVSAAPIILNWINPEYKNYGAK